MGFPWKIAAAGGLAFGALGVVALGVKTLEDKRRLPTPKRIALIGDSYAVGLGPELAKVFLDFKYEGAVGTNTAQWAAHAAACGRCGDWLATFKPGLTLVSLGVNDVKPDLQNYQTIVRGIHGIDSRVMWIEPPVQRMTNALYDTIFALGVERTVAPNIPLAADGLHPQSYVPWAQEIAETIARG